MQGKMRPILFSTPMVNAILEGRKTQTRRLIKAEPHLDFMGFILGDEKRDGSIGFGHINHMETVDIVKAKYKVGDILWVRESFQYRFEDKNQVGYKADFAHEPKVMNRILWKPSIHMPFAACRIFLRIKKISVDRLKSITNDDAISEGIEQQNGRWKNYYKPTGVDKFDFKDDLPVISFMSLWASINGIDSWIENPWVWVIEFERCEKPTI